jgi:mercuric ion transport protein
MHERSAGSGKWALATAATACVLSSTCCVLPLALVLIGFSGAWLARLRILAPYSPLLSAVAILALIAAGKAVFRPPGACDSKSPAQNSRPSRLPRVLFWLIAALVVIVIVLPLAAPVFY